MDYLKFFELEEEPFRNDSDPRFFFQTRAQARARLRLMRGVQQRKGLMIVWGGPGCGKTTLARHLLETLDGPGCTARMLSIPHAACDAGWVLPRVASAFGVAQAAADPVQVFGQVYERLAAFAHAGTLPVLLMDEAQLLRNQPVMEEIRGLLNLEYRDRRLVCMVLFGLPELPDVLRLDEPLAQRVEIGVELTGLERDESGDYVRHRLQKVGGSPKLFSDEAIDAIFTLTDGLPRLVNTLADNALFEASLNQTRPVDLSLITAAADQLGLGRRSQPEPAAPPDAAPVARAAPAPSSGLAASLGARAPSRATGAAPPAASAVAPEPAPARPRPTPPRPTAVEPEPEPEIELEPEPFSDAELETGELVLDVEPGHEGGAGAPLAEDPLDLDVPPPAASAPRPRPAVPRAGRPSAGVIEESADELDDLLDQIIEDGDEVEDVAVELVESDAPPAPRKVDPKRSALPDVEEDQETLDALFEDIQVQD